MIKEWPNFNSVQIISGPGVFKTLGQQLHSGKWLLVTTKGTTQRGLVEQIKKQLTTSHQLFIEDSIKPNPELEHLELLTTHYRNHEIDGLIALGGGSAIDSAKVLSVTLQAPVEKSLYESLEVMKFQQWNTHIPVIAIPTTSGTGAEVTPFATVWDTAKHKKYSVAGTQVYPVVALLDPQLTLSLPREQTLYTGLDATSHALESLWNKSCTSATEAAAWQALDMIATFLPLVLEEPNNVNARHGMQEASCLAGLAISQTRTAVAHSISYPLTSHYNIPHGLACSFTLPYLIEENLENFKKNQQSIAKRILTMLLKIDVKSEINKYIPSDISHLFKAMISPERSNNYKKQINLENIINNSIK